jgi:hypothetical protein
MVLEKLWTEDEVKALREMCAQGKSLEEMAEHLDRSLDAIRLKLHRLGLVISEKENNCSSSSSSTTTTLEPIKPAEQLISVEEAAKMTLGCIQRLNEKGLTGLDIKRIRLIIPALKSYIILQTDYIEKLAKVERHVEELNRVVLAQLEDKVAKAQTDEERKIWEEQLLSLKEKM